jgi:hypothetical protein
MSDERDDEPSGLPDPAAPEPPPLGPTEAAPEGEGEPRRGERAMPGIPTEGEPPSDG